MESRIMVDLVDLKNEIKKHFVIREEKDTVWSNLLQEETSYVNGSVYLNCERVPVKYLQQIDNDIITYNDANSRLLTISLQNSSNQITTSQLRDTVFYLDNNIINSTYTLGSGNKKLLVTFNKDYNGVLTVNVPPVNTKDEILTGFMFVRSLINQSITITNVSKTSNTVAVTVSVHNPCFSQTLKLSTLLRDGVRTHTFTTQKLDTDTDTTVTLTCALESSDKGILVELVPYNIVRHVTYAQSKSYTGDTVKQMW